MGVVEKSHEIKRISVGLTELSFALARVGLSQLADELCETASELRRIGDGVAEDYMKELKGRVDHSRGFVNELAGKMFGYGGKSLTSDSSVETMNEEDE